MWNILSLQSNAQITKDNHQVSLGVYFPIFKNPNIRHIFICIYIHPNIVQACIKYLLMSDSRNHMLDRFKKEFEGIWPRWRWCWWWWTRCICLHNLICICLHNLICICLHNSICICISGAYPNTSTGGKQWTVTEGEMVGCIIGLSPLSATKLLLYLYFYCICWVIF